MGYECLAFLLVIVITIALVLNMLQRFQADDGEHRDCGGNDHRTEGTCSPGYGYSPSDSYSHGSDDSTTDEPGGTEEPQGSCDQCNEDGVEQPRMGYGVTPGRKDTDCLGRPGYTTSDGEFVREDTDCLGRPGYRHEDGSFDRQDTDCWGRPGITTSDGEFVREDTDCWGRPGYRHEDGSFVREDTEFISPISGETRKVYKD